MGEEEAAVVEEDQELEGYASSRGRGRGHGFRGRYRGEYNRPYADTQQDRTYNQEPPV
ncbi:Hexosyltransferase [Psidium guajava]|nr:Hexosyltransferase [Psidium guajava]